MAGVDDGYHRRRATDAWLHRGLLEQEPQLDSPRMSSATSWTASAYRRATRPLRAVLAGWADPMPTTKNGAAAAQLEKENRSCGCVGSANAPSTSDGALRLPPPDADVTTLSGESAVGSRYAGCCCPNPIFAARRAKNPSMPNQWRGSSARSRITLDRRRVPTIATSSKTSAMDSRARPRQGLPVRGQTTRAGSKQKASASKSKIVPTSARKKTLERELDGSAWHRAAPRQGQGTV